MEMVFVLLTSLILSSSLGFAKPAKVARTGKVAQSPKTSCSHREIQRQDCRLRLHTYSLSLLPTTIARDDGTWRAVDDMPLKGEGTAWEKIEFGLFHEWPILQLWIWDKAQGEASVQQLHWYAADIRDKNQLHIISEGIVRRRRMKQVEVVEGKPAPKPSFTLDAMEKHSLKALKDGNLEWTLGSEKKILDKHAAPPVIEKPNPEKAPEKAEHHGV